MSHNLNTTRGRVSFAFTGPREAIWHGLGSQLPDSPTYADVMTASQADYDVALRPVFTADMQEIPGWHRVARLDTNATLGLVEGRYVPIRNRDAFSWLEHFTGLTYSTAGVLGVGERAWIMARVDDVSIGGGDDPIDLYLAIQNSFDRSSSLTVFMSATRVVCQNTLSWSLAGASRVVKIRHTSSWRDRLQTAEQVMGLSRKYMGAMAEAYATLNSIALAPSTLDSLLTALVPGDSTRAINTRADMLTLTHTGRGNAGRTLADFANGVAEYVDFYRSPRSSKKSARQQAESLFRSSILDGTGTALKQRAFDLALEAANHSAS